MSINKYVVRSTLVGALGGLLFGFNTAVISGTTAGLTHAFGLSVRQLGITVSIALWGTVVGALAAGVLGQRYGSREMLRLTAVLYLISSIGCAIAPILPLLLVARFLGGLGIGGSSVLGPVYIAELAPAHLRGRLVGTFQVNIVIGILLAYLSNYLISLLRLGAHEWRWEFGVASVPAFIFFCLLFTIPRSARWLTTQSRSELGNFIRRVFRERLDGLHVTIFAEGEVGSCKVMGGILMGVCNDYVDDDEVGVELKSCVGDRLRGLFDRDNRSKCREGEEAI
ncbi:MFS transporter [Granulicella sp. L46]|uniref:MFS transporter n=1 Tax=Granulicella sp. L46 TaxID=1641865 RepID=UPI00352958FA